MRVIATGACAAALGMAMPAISASDDARRDEARARMTANLFAELGDGAATVRAQPESPSLLQHPWIVRIEHSLERDSHAALDRYGARDRDAAALQSVASFQSDDFEQAEAIVEQHQCLAEAVYYEARSENVSGQLAVAEVVTNRVRDHRYPNSICEVVYQGATRTTGCQFSFTCDGSLALEPRGTHWKVARSVATQVLMNLHERRTGDATHYHANYVSPIWRTGLVRTERIGVHIFYRFPQGREWARVRQASAAPARQTRSSGGIQTVSSDVKSLNRQSLSVLKTAPAPAP